MSFVKKIFISNSKLTSSAKKYVSSQLACEEIGIAPIILGANFNRDTFEIEMQKIEGTNIKTLLSFVNSVHHSKYDDFVEKIMGIILDVIDKFFTSCLVKNKFPFSFSDFMIESETNKVFIVNFGDIKKTKQADRQNIFDSYLTLMAESKSIKLKQFELGNYETNSIFYAHIINLPIIDVSIFDYSDSEHITNLQFETSSTIIEDDESEASEAEDSQSENSEAEDYNDDESEKSEIDEKQSTDNVVCEKWMLSNISYETIMKSLELCDHLETGEDIHQLTSKEILSEYQPLSTDDNGLLQDVC
jgi:hypothetical protein